jgi:hypothetical protein
MVTSRNYLYYSNGLEAPRKVNPSYTSANTDSLTGIALPIISPSVGLYDDRPGVYNAGSPGNLGVLNTTLRSGWGYSSPPTVTVTDTNGGTGTGCTITVSLTPMEAFSNLCHHKQRKLDTPKRKRRYLAEVPRLGHGSLVLYTQTNPSAPDAGKVVAADLGGIYLLWVGVNTPLPFGIALQAILLMPMSWAMSLCMGPTLHILSLIV